MDLLRLPRRRRVMVALLLAVLVSTGVSGLPSASAASNEGSVEITVLNPDGTPNRLARFDIRQRTSTGGWYPLRDDEVGTETSPGHYRVAGIPESTIRIYVLPYSRFLPYEQKTDVAALYYPDAPSIDDAQDIHVVAGETVTLPTAVRLQASGQATGRLDPASSAPNASYVGVMRWDGNAWANDYDVPVTLDDDGTYHLRRVGAGPYRLRFSGTQRSLPRGSAPTSYWSDVAPGRLTYDESAARSFSVAPGGSKQLGTTTRPLNGTLSGRILDPDGRPLSGVDVTIDDDWDPVLTDSSGAWTYGRTHPGTYRLTIGPAVAQRLGYPVEPLTSTATVSLEKSTTVTTRLKHAPPVISPIRLNAGRLAAIDELLVSDFTVFPSKAKVSYQWVVLGKNRRAVKGATHRGFRPADSMARQPVALRVTASAYGRTTVAYSVARPIVRDDSALTPRVNAVQGVVSRYYRGPQMLSLRLGSGGYPEEEQWQWFRDAEPIRGATQENYLSTAADIGHVITGRRYAPALTAPYLGAVAWTRSSKVTRKAVPLVQPSARALGDRKVALEVYLYVEGVAPKYFDGYVTVYRKGAGPTPVARLRAVKAGAKVTLANQPLGVQGYTFTYTPVRAGHGKATSALRRATVR